MGTARGGGILSVLREGWGERGRGFIDTGEFHGSTSAGAGLELVHLLHAFGHGRLFP